MIETQRWKLPPIFAQLQAGGSLASDEMARTFNCGIGMAVIVAAEDKAGVTELLEGGGERVFEIGRVEAGDRGCTVNGVTGSWGAAEDWSVTHHA